MVSRCFNPPCSARFRYLEDGSLFRLEPDAVTRAPVIEAEYFWLCNRCAATFTLALSEDGRVVLEVRPHYAHGLRNDLPLTISRRPGMLLRSVSFWPRPSSTVNESLLQPKPRPGVNNSRTAV